MNQTKYTSASETLTGPGHTPNPNLPPIAPAAKLRTMLIEIEAPEDFKHRLDNQWVVEREIHADRWTWRWKDGVHIVQEPPPMGQPTVRAMNKPDETGYWGQIELMGHQRIAGHITETTVAGKGMLRVDVPDADGTTTHTRFYSPEAVYCISPTDRQIAIGLAANIKSQPVTIYDVARLASDKTVGTPEEDPNDE